MREEEWEFPPRGLKEKLDLAQIGGVGVMVTPVTLWVTMGEVKITQGVTRAEICCRGRGETFKWLYHTLFSPLQGAVQNHPRKARRRAEFLSCSHKIWSVYVSSNVNMQFMLWGYTMKHFGPRLYPSHAQFSSMGAHQESLQIDVSVAKSRIWYFTSSTDGVFFHSYTNTEAEGSCL